MVFLFFAAMPSCPHAVIAQGRGDDPSSWVGLSLTDLIQRFGVPRAVYPARGQMEWQDDVVFVYDEGDFYLYKDRVWQLGLRSARGINAGDPAGVAALILGSKAEMRGNSVFCSLPEGSWPLMLRCDADEAGRVKAIFIFRADL